MSLREISQEANVEIDVGRRLREIRCERGLSIRALAEKSGLNVNTISLIENEKTSPSVATLQQIAMALGIPISDFFETKHQKTNAVFQKANQRPHTTFSHGAIDDLCANLARDNLEPFLVTLKPKSGSGRNIMVHTGLELVYCLEGSLVYTVGEEVYRLEEGDSLFFEAHLPHRWRNSSDRESRFLLILLRDEESDEPAEMHFQ